MTGSDEPGYSLARRRNSPDLSEADSCMVHYARMLTRDPGSIERGDIDRLRELGFGERAVLDICQVVSYYNYVNRLADGLGVELEDWWAKEDMVMTRAEFEVVRR